MPVSAPVPSSSSSTVGVERRGGAVASEAAQTETAEPPSISRLWPITPPAPQPISPSGREHLVDRLQRGLGRREDRARDEDDRQVAGRAAKLPRRAADAASSAAVRASGTVERPVPMRTGMTA